jgi:hypothetical protein
MSIAITILLSLAFLAVFVVCVWYTTQKTNAIGTSILLNVAFVVPLMSHVWHLAFGEELLADQCAVNASEVFGWTSCLEGLDFYTVYFNSYEITVAVESIVLYVLGIVLVLTSPVIQKSVAVNAIVISISAVGICSAFCLFLLPAEYMQWYTILFNVLNLIFTLVIILVIEQNLKRATFQTVATEDKN